MDDKQFDARAEAQRLLRPFKHLLGSDFADAEDSLVNWMHVRAAGQAAAPAKKCTCFAEPGYRHLT